MGERQRQRGSLFIRACLVGLVCTLQARWPYAVAAGAQRRWEAAMSRHGMTAALASAGGDRASQMASGLAGAGSTEAQRPPDGINHRGRAGGDGRCAELSVHVHVG
nr:unnamed protein product [Digitaria exilis]